MTLKEFKESIPSSSPVPGITPYLLSLWYDAKGDWSKAHTIIQDIEDENAAWIHAYLHRKEGDIGNADYWYRRAGKIRPVATLGEEWENIVKTLIED